jgi:hypothetical protein
LTAAGAGQGAAAAAAQDHGSSTRGPTDPLATAVFALLVAACFGAFFLTQRLKHTPTAVQRFQRTPTFAPRSAIAEQREEHISFKLAKADSVTVAIVDSNLDVVATLLRDYPLPRYKQLSLRWNGRRGIARGYGTLVSASGHRTLVPRTAGPPAPPGEYRVRVNLLRQEREVLSPWSFTLRAGVG